MKSVNYNTLIHAATYYLSYQDRIGRDFMISESSLKYPIAEYLTSLELPVAQIKLEFNHPELWKRSIDLVTTDPTEKKIDTAFEFKLAKYVTKNEPEQKRIFNDLMRLHLLARVNQTECYFLVAGTHSNFIQYFRSITTQPPAANSQKLADPEGFYTEWFKFNPGGEQEFDVKKVIGNNYAQVYQAFLADYKLKDGAHQLKLPEKLKTKCIAITALSRESPTPYVGGLWKVE
jgi:hypothetical protein